MSSTSSSSSRDDDDGFVKGVSNDAPKSVKQTVATPEQASAAKVYGTAAWTDGDHLYVLRSGSLAIEVDGGDTVHSHVLQVPETHRLHPYTLVPALRNQQTFSCDAYLSRNDWCRIYALLLPTASFELSKVYTTGALHVNMSAPLLGGQVTSILQRYLQRKRAPHNANWIDQHDTMTEWRCVYKPCTVQTLGRMCLDGTLPSEEDLCATALYMSDEASLPFAALIAKKMAGSSDRLLLRIAVKTEVMKTRFPLHSDAQQREMLHKVLVSAFRQQISEAKYAWFACWSLQTQALLDKLGFRTSYEQRIAQRDGLIVVPLT